MILRSRCCDVNDDERARLMAAAECSDFDLEFVVFFRGGPKPITVVKALKEKGKVDGTDVDDSG